MQHASLLPYRGTHQRTHQRMHQRGLTLVELLVSMVILGFVMTLVSEAIFQVAQVTRAAETTTRGLAARWGAGWTASDLFANLVAPEGSPRPVMQGSATRVSGFTTAPLDGSGQGIQAFALELRPAADIAGQTEMVMFQRASDAISETASVVAAFPGRANFAYVDRSGRSAASWPAVTRAEGDAEDLPRVVQVLDASSGAILMLYSFQGEVTQPSPIRSPFGESP